MPATISPYTLNRKVYAASRMQGLDIVRHKPSLMRTTVLNRPRPHEEICPHRVLWTHHSGAGSPKLRLTGARDKCIRDIRISVHYVAQAVSAARHGVSNAFTTRPQSMTCHIENSSGSQVKWTGRARPTCGGDIFQLQMKGIFWKESRLLWHCPFRITGWIVFILQEEQLVRLTI